MVASRTNRYLSEVCPGCGRRFQYLRKAFCGKCLGKRRAGTTKDKELPDIGIIECPVDKLDVERKVCVLRRRAAFKYAREGKSYSMWRCAACEEGVRSTQLMAKFKKENAEQDDTDG